LSTLEGARDQGPDPAELPVVTDYHVRGIGGLLPQRSARYRITA
jgi:hypothetical protein